MDNKEIIEDAEIVRVYDENDNDEGLKESVHFLFGKDSLESVTIEDMDKVINKMRELIGGMEQMWNNYKFGYKVTEEHLKLLADFNAEHCDPKADDVDESQYDRFNGLNKMTKEDVIRIFGDNSMIIDPDDHTKTIKTVKDIVESYFGWMTGMKQFKHLENTYMDLIEDNENAKMSELKKLAEAESDEKKKELMLKAYDEYYALKYLDYLSDPIDDFRMNIMCGQFTNADKINYLIERTKEKLTEMKFSSMFVLELSNFETRFLDPKYKDLNNVLLLWFLNKVVYGDMKDNKKKDKAMVISFVIAMDRFIRNRWSDEIKERILNNVIKLEDQMMEPILKALKEYKEKNNK